MSTSRYIVGDSLTVLRSLPSASVDLVVTSPAFLNLRSYLSEDHPDKDLEMGHEGSPAAFIDALLDVVEELRRVLVPTGSIAVELGDSYSGSGGAGGDYDDDGMRAGQLRYRAAPRNPEPDARYGAGRDWDHERASRSTKRDGMEPWPGYPAAKSLCLIPELFRLALAYGRNPISGRETPKWIVRNVIRWCRPNPMVGRLGDKVRPAVTDMVIATMSPQRYFDLDALRQVNPRAGETSRTRAQMNKGAVGYHTEGDSDPAAQNADGAPPLDHWWADDDRFDDEAWIISPSNYLGPHYATFPPRLVIRPILAMCPPGGVVLDPFAGTGTVGMVANGCGRDAVLIDLDPANAELARQRCGMFLEVEYPEGVVR